MSMSMLQLRLGGSRKKLDNVCEAHPARCSSKGSIFSPNPFRLSLWPPSEGAGERKRTLFALVDVSLVVDVVVCQTRISIERRTSEIVQLVRLATLLARIG